MPKPQNAKAQNNQFWREQSMKRGKEIDQLRAENDALRRQLAVLTDNKVEAALPASVLSARQKRDQYRDMAALLHRENEQFRALLPMNVLSFQPGAISEEITSDCNSDGRWRRSVVAMIAFARDTSTGGFQVGFTGIGVYDAPREQATEELLKLVRGAILPMPQAEKKAS